MCGIAGIWGATSIGGDTRLLSMMHRISHRGPDSSGIWCSDDASLQLGHVRLAVQDLSSLGHQPMRSSAGRFVITFNGEIYNFRQLAKLLSNEGFVFKGHSDTEVMLAAFEFWGVERAVSRFEGMFAFAVYDREADSLWLSRDRAGEKPLYYTFTDGEFLFASELKAVLTGLNRRMRLNKTGLAHYFRFGYFPATLSPVEGVYKLPAASVVCFRRGEILARRHEGAGAVLPTTYWKQPVPEINHPARGTEEHVRNLEALLSSAVSDQAIADVNIGVFLSGGIDSSIVAALLQRQSDNPISTYTVAFDSPEHNEAPFAAKIASHLKTNHTEIPLSVRGCFDVLEKLPDLLDEPFADASLIPTYLVCAAARQHATVCLSGDGGDELFAGYNRYIWGQKVAALAQKYPFWLRSGVSNLIQSVPYRLYEKINPFLSLHARLQGREKAEKDIGNKLYKLADSLRAVDERALYVYLLSFWKQSPLLDHSMFESSVPADFDNVDFSGDFINAAMQTDFRSYLIGDNLFKVDRAAMATSLEVRLPILDRRVVEYVSKLPLDLKVRQGSSKWLLRELLFKHVPRAMLERPKMGFSVPLAVWLRNELYHWGLGLIGNGEELAQWGISSSVVSDAWASHQAGARDNANALWAVMMFIIWARKNREFLQ